MQENKKVILDMGRESRQKHKQRRGLRKYPVEILATIAFLLGVFGLVHQKLYTTGGWFNWEQFWHHEPLIALCFVSAVALFVGKKLTIHVK